MYLSSPSYAKIRPLIQDGDLMILKRPGLITWGTRSDASHAAMFVWRRADMNTLSIAESREKIGSRVLTFSSQVRAFPGMIDIYRPNEACPENIRSRAATIAYNWAGRDYNYPGLFDLAIDEMPIIRFILDKLGRQVDRGDPHMSSWDAPKFCSQLYTWAYRRAAYELGITTSWDPAPRYGDKWVTPGMLSHSAAFTLIATNIMP